MNRIMYMAAMALLATGCKKDKVSPEAPSTRILSTRVSDVVKNNDYEFITHYEYNQEGRCTRYYNGDQMNISYNGSVVTETVTSAASVPVSRTTYYMRTGMLPDSVLLEKFRGSSYEPTDIFLYSYNNASEPVLIKQCPYTNRNIGRATEYTWANGDIVQALAYDLDQSGPHYRDSIQYTYDLSKENNLKIDYPRTWMTVTTPNNLTTLSGVGRHLATGYTARSNTGFSKHTEISYTFDDKGRVSSADIGTIRTKYIYE